MKIVTGSSTNSFLWFHLPVILYAVGIFILSSIPDLNAPDLGIEPQDKLYHFIFYTPFGYLLARSFCNQNLFHTVKRSYWIFAISIGVLYGISDEIHQYFVPGRLMSIWDIFANGLGICFGVVLFYHRSRLFSFLLRKPKR